MIIIYKSKTNLPPKVVVLISEYISNTTFNLFFNTLLIYFCNVPCIRNLILIILFINQIVMFFSNSVLKPVNITNMNIYIYIYIYIYINNIVNRYYKYACSYIFYKYLWFSCLMYIMFIIKTLLYMCSACINQGGVLLLNVNPMLICVPCRFGYQFISIFSSIFFFVYLINYILLLLLLYIYIFI